MRTLLMMSAIAGLSVIGACSKEPPPTTNAIYPVVVGEKTELYEVMGRNDLKLGPGVKIKVVQGPGGNNNNAFLLLRANGTTGGYMACGCVGAQTSSCRTENDNPDHASCSGGCTDSEGNPHGCDLFGPLPGPPKDPVALKFVARQTR